MKNIFSILLMTSITFVFFGCSDSRPLRGDLRGENFPLSKSVPETRPTMDFDASNPYRLEFGRGSGWHGLDTIALDEKGNAVLHRLHAEQKGNVIHHYWERTTVSLDAKMIKEIATLIRDLRILNMQRAYHADVCDGTQWVFWLVQGGQEKSVYFDNHFPKPIQDFAVALDGKLRSVGIDEGEWTRIPDNQSRAHEEAIWNSIKDKPNHH